MGESATFTNVLTIFEQVTTFMGQFMSDCCCWFEICKCECGKISIINHL